MKVDIKIPTVGESITEATISQWLKKDGEAVQRDEVLLSLDTDKASVEVVAEKAGTLKISAAAGKVVPIGSVVGYIDDSLAPTAGASPKAEAAKPAAPGSTTTPIGSPAAMMMQPPAAKNGGSQASNDMSPAVRRVVAETGVDTSGIQGTGRGGRLTKGDVLNPQPTAPVPAPTKAPSAPAPAAPAVRLGGENVRREPMTSLRKTIAKRLVEAQHTAAILTTFNEIDMTAAQELRAKYKDGFEKQYGMKLGFMGLFAKAVIEAIRAYPKLNASIEGDEVVYHEYVHLGIAVSTPKGLVVPVIKHADQMSLAEIEQAIAHFAAKARDNKLTMDDLSGGTYTISNGGTFGSMMSTPILNPPQSGILGLHKIEDRPVVINKQVVVRPMMYVAMSYDHRLIDGSESVRFLVRVKECMEDPSRILLEI